MALLLTKGTKYGVDGVYHRVQDIRDHVIEVALYTTKDDRTQGKSMLQLYRFVATPGTFSETTLTLAGNTPLVLAYKYLKTLETFKGATDD